MFALLAGAALSFKAGHHHRHGHRDHRAAFEARVARVCVDAARRADESASGATVTQNATPPQDER